MSQWEDTVAAIGARQESYVKKLERVAYAAREAVRSSGSKETLEKLDYALQILEGEPDVY